MRYDLIKKNNIGKPASRTGRYLNYAIGEIIPVLIGILIAIQLNTFKSNNDKRNQEIAHLENILSDLKQD